MEFNQIYEYPLACFFVWIMWAVASGLATLQFQLVEYSNIWLIHFEKNENIFFFFTIFKWADDSNAFEIGTLVLLLIWIFVIIFTLCEPGARMTSQFEAFNDELGQYHWYLLPIEIQRMYLIFASNTQHPVNIYSYGGFTCERKTLKNVIFEMIGY